MLMDSWCVWSCIIEACPLIDLFKLRRVCHAFKTKCDEIMSTIVLPGSQVDNEKDESLLDAVKSHAFHKFPRCGDYSIIKCLVWKCYPGHNDIANSIWYSIGLSHNKEAITYCASNTLSILPVIGIVSRDGPLKSILDVIPMYFHIFENNSNQMDVFKRATPAWQMSLFNTVKHSGYTDNGNGDILYSDLMASYLQNVNLWCYELIVDQWNMYTKHLWLCDHNTTDHVVHQLLQHDNTDLVIDLTNHVWPAAIVLNLTVKDGIKWPFILASCTLFDPNSILHAILYRDNLDEELVAIGLCIDRGATLNARIMIEHKHPGLFEMWMKTEGGCLSIEKLEPYMSKFEDWQLLMIAQYQPYHRGQVLRHAVNRGMFEVVTTLFDDYHVELTSNMYRLLQPPNQILKAYLLHKIK